MVQEWGQRNPGAKTTGDHHRRLFISEGLAQGKVLVHCSAAHGLSAAVCAAFLMQKDGWIGSAFGCDSPGRAPNPESRTCLGKLESLGIAKNPKLQQGSGS